MIIKNYLYPTKKPIKPIYIGYIGTPYGVQGWIKIYSFTIKKENIFSYKPWFISIKNKWYLISEVNWKFYKNYFLFQNKNIKDRNIVSLLINSNIYINDYQLPKIDDNMFYWKDLIGCTVINCNNFNFGKVINLIETGANDVMIVKNINLSNRDYLIPFIYKKVIKNVDLIKHEIKVNWYTN